MAKYPYVILHELAHAYHDQILGFEHKEILHIKERKRKTSMKKCYYFEAENQALRTHQP